MVQIRLGEISEVSIKDTVINLDLDLVCGISMGLTQLSGINRKSCT